MMARPFILTLSCADRPGIVAAIATHLFDHGFNILDAQQFDDTETGQFFMRVVFASTGKQEDEHPRRAFGAVAEQFGRSWTLASSDERVVSPAVV